MRGRDEEQIMTTETKKNKTKQNKTKKNEKIHVTHEPT